MTSPNTDKAAHTDLKLRIKGQFFTTDSERTVDKLYVALTSRGDFGYSSMEHIAAACQELLSAGELAACYRVNSPFGDQPGLHEYNSPDEIPATAVDDWDDPPIPFEVRPENITVIYRRGPNYVHPVPLELRILEQFKTRKTERSFVRLVEIFGAEDLDATLCKLRDAGHLSEVYRVHSPVNDKEPIYEFAPGAVIPDTLIDTSLDVPAPFAVNDNDIASIYTRGPKFVL